MMIINPKKQTTKCEKLMHSLYLRLMIRKRRLFYRTIRYKH